MTDAPVSGDAGGGLGRGLWQAMAGPVASIALTLAIILVVGLIWVGPRFLSSSNVTIIGAFVAVPLIIGACSGFALLAGVVDLSIGSMVGFSSALFATLLAAGWGLPGAGAVTLAACLVFGAVNAVAIVGCGANSIAATLGMLTALRGLTWVIVGSTGSVFAFHPAFFDWINFRLLGVPTIFLIGLVLSLAATFVVAKTRMGRHVRASGGDPRAAVRAGIPVARIRVIALLLSALGAGLGGILYVGQLGSAARGTGFGLEFEIYAALMIGGYSILRGGVGTPLGGALGLLAVAGVSNIVDLKAVSPYYANIVVGMLLISAVLLDRVRGGDAYE